MSTSTHSLKSSKPGIVQPDGTVEFISDGNTGVGQDGNYRKKMVGGKLQTQKLILGVWTPLDEI